MAGLLLGSKLKKKIAQPFESKLVPHMPALLHVITVILSIAIASPFKDILLNSQKYFFYYYKKATEGNTKYRKRNAKSKHLIEKDNLLL